MRGTQKRKVPVGGGRSVGRQQAPPAKPRLRLYKFQREGITRLRANRRHALFDEMGLGKTVQTIVALPSNRPVMVVCPASVKYNWRDEIRKWRPDLKVSVQAKSRTFRWPKPGEVRILNYEILPPAQREIARLRASYDPRQKTVAENKSIRLRVGRLQRLRASLTAPYPGTFLVGDEAHMLKNPGATRTIRWRECAALVHQREGSIWILTGTPLLNYRDELYAVLQAAGLGVEAFGSRAQYRLDWAMPGVVAQKLRSVSLTRLREQVLPDLPKKTRETRVVRVSRAMRAECDSLVRALAARGVHLDRATLEDIRRAQDSVDIKQHVSRTRVLLAKAKIPAMLEFVCEMEAAKVPLVMFSAHRAPIDLLGRRRGWACITGDQSAAQKRKREEGFRTGKISGLALTIRSGGVGLNLERAWRAGFVDLEYTPALVSQSEDRLARLTQKASALLYTRFVIDHPIERRIEELIREKQERIDGSVVLSAVKEGEA